MKTYAAIFGECQEEGEGVQKQGGFFSCVFMYENNCGSGTLKSYRENTKRSYQNKQIYRYIKKNLELHLNKVNLKEFERKRYVANGMLD